MSAEASNKSKTFSFEWCIHDLDGRTDLDTKIKSQYFKLLGCIWHVALESNDLVFWLWRDSVEDGTKTFVDCKLTLLTVNGLKIFEQLVERACEKSSVCTFFLKEIPVKPLSTLPGCTLIVRCEIVGCNVPVPKDTYFKFTNKVETERVLRYISIENISDLMKKNGSVHYYLHDPIFTREFKKRCTYASHISDCVKHNSTNQEIGVQIYFRNFNKKASIIVYTGHNHFSKMHLSILNVECKEVFEMQYPLFQERDLPVSEQDNTYFPDDILRLKIEIEMKNVVDQKCDFSCFGNGWSSTIFDKNASKPSLAPPDKPTFSAKLEKDLFDMFQTGGSSDFSLEVGQKSIPVHKAILEARSPMFKDLFETNKKASSSDIFQEFSPNTVQTLLLFIYTGKIEQNDVTLSAHELYVAASKCILQDLKEYCIEVMMTEFSSSSACDLLLLAHENQDKEFKEKIQKQILAHEKDVLLSANWKKLLKDHTDLTLETFQVISELRLKQAN